VTTLTSNPALARPLAPVAPAIAVIVFGIALYLTAGFAWPSALHNATHDTRHSLGLPCH
jgi:cobalt transporter subunit CbtB